MYMLQQSTHFTPFVTIYAYFYVTLGGHVQLFMLWDIFSVVSATRLQNYSDSKILNLTNRQN